MPTASGRDTDEDWRLIGENEPYWGVITQPEFRRANLDQDAIERFYANGRSQIAILAARLEAATGSRPSGRALDFGCGAGRLAEAMCDYAAEVIGYDISPGMLAEARRRGGRATYVSLLPSGPFDWINSYIVFQHIPPPRGVDLIETLVGMLADGGHLSLQLTIWREDHIAPPILEAPGEQGSAAPPVGAIMMYDYDLSEVLKRLHLAGVDEVKLFHTNHGGHHGVEILARRGRRRG